MSSRTVRRIRTLALVAGLLAAVVTASPHAVAQDTGEVRATPALLASADAAVRQVDVDGTAWHVDHTTGTLVVTADRTVTAEGIARIEAAVRSTAPGALKIHRTPGRIAEHTAGGDPIFGPGARCAVGFNVQGSSSVKYALTAGHCGILGGTWSPVGPVVSTSFPGSDYALLRYSDPSTAEGGVRAADGGLTDIVDARNPVVGDSACVSAPSGVRCGIVIGLNATVNYGDGIVTGLIEARLCTEPGDSGAPLYTGHTALGMVSGGSGNCSAGGTTYFQPVLEPLNAYGVSVF